MNMCDVKTGRKDYAYVLAIIPRLPEDAVVSGQLCFPVWR